MILLLSWNDAMIMMILVCFFLVVLFGYDRIFESALNFMVQVQMRQEN